MDALPCLSSLTFIRPCAESATQHIGPNFAKQHRVVQVADMPPELRAEAAAAQGGAEGKGESGVKMKWVVVALVALVAGALSHAGWTLFCTGHAPNCEAGIKCVLVGRHVPTQQ